MEEEAAWRRQSTCRTGTNCEMTIPKVQLVVVVIETPVFRQPKASQLQQQQQQQQQQRQRLRQ